MSYSKSFRRTIRVPYYDSKTVQYPASQSGGSLTVNFSGTAEEEVIIDVDVDTRHFDDSIDDCNNNVNGLTASVTAMDAAQCMAISKNAEKISRALIKGFFHTVRTDLSTQKAVLVQTINSRLALLRQQAATLLEKRKNMEADYARTTARYQKIFNDLNNELSIRIHRLDQPVFEFVSNVGAQSERMLHTDLIQTAVTFNKETNKAQAQLNAAKVKSHALTAMHLAQRFLVSEAVTKQALENTIINGKGTSTYYIPVCLMECTDEHLKGEKKCYVPQTDVSGISNLGTILIAVIEQQDFEFGDKVRQEILPYIHSEIARKIKGNDKHSKRVKELINTMIKKNIENE